jgi:hypothetical protein
LRVSIGSLMPACSLLTQASPTLTLTQVLGPGGGRKVHLGGVHSVHVVEGELVRGEQARRQRRAMLHKTATHVRFSRFPPVLIPKQLGVALHNKTSQQLCFEFLETVKLTIKPNHPLLGLRRVAGPAYTVNLYPTPSRAPDPPVLLSHR